MIFMMPMPPTIRETEAMAPSRIDITRAELSCAAKTSARLRTVKSSSWSFCSRWRCLRSAAISASAALIGLRPDGLHHQRADRAGVGLAGAGHLRLAVEIGMRMTSS